ncbi:MAG: archease [Caldilineaceae bacterium]|nr:archease [Caldilineaceae bacterium]
MFADDCQVTELEHTAEIGLQVRAASAPTLFACIAQAMFALVGLTPDTTAAGTPHTVSVAAPDVESLLVDWLSELAYLYEVHGTVMQVSRITAWSPTELTADLVGYPSTTVPAMHIKAVTYHDLRVGPEGDGWRARVYFDI